MKVWELKNALDEFDDETEVALLRKRTNKHWFPVEIDGVRDGDTLTDYDKDFGGKAVIE